MKKWKIKLLHVIMLTIIIGQVTVTSIYNASEIVATTVPKTTASTTHTIDDLNQIDWSSMAVGDKLDIAQQDVSGWDSFKVISNLQNTIYNPEDDSWTVSDRDVTIIESKYQIDLQSPFSLSVRFKADSQAGPWYGKYGFIQLYTRPYYLRTAPSINYSDAGTSENSWYMSNDNGSLIAKYKEEGNFRIGSKVANVGYNTININVDNSSKIGKFSHCILPTSDTSLSCSNSSATSVATKSSSISAKYLNNQFAAIRFSPGENATIEVAEIKMYAKVKSYGDISYSTSNITVAQGTTLEEIHELASPVYNEFIDYEVTEVGREVEISDMTSDGGYNSAVAGVYNIEYTVENGFGTNTTTTKTLTVNVVDEATTAAIDGQNASIMLSTAPTSESELNDLLNISAYDPNNQTDITSQVRISNKSGYSYTSPKAGTYDITYYVTGSNTIRVFKTVTLKLVNDSQVENLVVTEKIVGDTDNKISMGEEIELALTVENSSGIDLSDGSVTYQFDSEIYNIDSLDTTSIEGLTYEVDKSKNTLKIADISLRAEKSATFTFKVTANSKFYINRENQDLTKSVSVIESAFKEKKFTNTINEDLDINGNTEFENQFTVTEAEGDNKVINNEEVTFTHSFKNPTNFYINGIGIELNESTNKVTFDPKNFTITSSKRDLSTDDYQIVNNNLVILTVIVPGEEIVVNYTNQTNSSFVNSEPIQFAATHYVYTDSEATTVYAKEEITANLDIDYQKIMNFAIETTINDANNNKISPSEEFKIKFSVDNTGAIGINDLVISADLSDVNISEEQIDSSNLVLSITNNKTKTIKYLKSNEYQIVDGEIIVNDIPTNSKLNGTITLTAKSTISTEQLVELDSLIIGSTLEYSDELMVNRIDEVSLPIDSENLAAVKSSSSVVEELGDGDSQIDPNEQFSFNYEIKNTGKIDLDNLKVTPIYDVKNGIDNLNSQVTFEIDGENYTEYTKTDDYYTLNKIPVGSTVVIKILTTFGNEISGNHEQTDVVVEQAYLQSNINISNSVKVDKKSNQNISFVANSSVSTAKQGDTVPFELEIKNTGSTVENNLSVNFKLDENNFSGDISQLHVNSSLTDSPVYTITSTGITISKLNANEKITITFSANLNESFMIDVNQGASYKLVNSFILNLEDGIKKASVVEIQPIVATPKIEVESSFNSQFGGKQLVANDVLELQYKITNGNDINLTNNTITFSDLGADINSVLAIDVISDNSDLQYEVNVDEREVTFINLGVNESVQINVTATSDNQLTSDPLNSGSVIFTSDFLTNTLDFNIEKNLEAETNLAINNTLVSTSSGNLEVNASEQIVVDTVIKNTGNVDLKNITITGMNDSNIINSEIISIKDSAGNEYTDFTFTNGFLVIAELDVDEELIIRYEFETNSTIEYMDNYYLTTVASVNSRQFISYVHVPIDLESNDTITINTSYEPVQTDGDGKLDPNETIKAIITIENTSELTNSNIIIEDYTTDSNLQAGYSNFEIVNQDGEQFIDYQVKDNKIIIEQLTAHQNVIVKYNKVVESTLNQNQKATIITAVTATYPVIGEATKTSYADYYLDRENNSDYTLEVSAQNKNGETAVEPGDSIDLTLQFTNTGSTDLTNIKVENIADANVDYSKVSIDPFDITSGKLSGNNYYLNELKAGESKEVNITVATKSTFNTAEKIIFSFKTECESLISYVSSELGINRSQANVSIDLLSAVETGDNDGLIDPNESIEMKIKVTNTGKFALEDVFVSTTSNSDNLESISDVSIVVQNAPSGVIIKQLNPGSSAIISYKLNFKQFLQSETVSKHVISVDHPYFATVNREFSRDVDVVNNTSVVSNLEVITANDSVMNNEKITYKFTLENTGQRIVEDLVILNQITDINLQTPLTNQVVKIDDTELTNVYNSDTGEYTIPQLKPGEVLTISYDVYTTSEIAVGYFRKLFNVYISNSFTYESVLKYVSGVEESQVLVSEAISELTIKSKLSDTDGNKLINPSETIDYSLEISNTGAVNYSDTKIDLSTYGLNINKEQLISITGENTTLVEGTDYVMIDNVITLFNIAPDDKYTINYQLDATSTLYPESNLRVVATVSNQLIDTQTLIDELEVDTQTRNIVTTLSTNKLITETNMYSDFEYVLTIDNKGQTNESDVLVTVTDYTENLITNGKTVVLLDGRDITATAKLQGSSLIIPSIPAGSKIVVKKTTKATNNLIIDADINTEIEFVMKSKVQFDTDTIEEVTTKFSIDKSKVSSINVESNLQEMVLENEAADPNEQLIGTIKVENNNHLQQDNVNITIENDSVNGNHITDIQVMDSSFNTLDSNRYTIDNNQVNIGYLTAGETIYVVYEYSTKSEFEYSNSQSKQTLTDKITILTGSGLNYAESSVLSLNENLADVTFNISYLVNGQTESKVESGDVITYQYQLVNSGAYIERDVQITSEAIDDNYDIVNIDNMQVFNNNVKLVKNVDYSVIGNSISINELKPNDRLTITNDYTVPNQLFNLSSINSYNYIQTTSGITKALTLGIPIDFSQMTQMTPEIQMIDADEQLLLTEGEQVTYNYTLDNDGDINYVHLTNSVDLSKGLVNADTLSYTFKLNGELIDLELTPTQTKNVYTFELVDFEIGDKLELQIKYSAIGTATKVRSVITSNINAYQYDFSTKSSLLTDVDTIDNSVEKSDPYLTGSNNATIDEHTVLTDEQLVELYNINGNIGANRELSVNHNIDFTSPGQYKIVFTLTDNDTNKQFDLTSSLKIEDILPTITGSQSVSIYRNTLIDNYLTAFNISAFEGTVDLTQEVVVDYSRVDYSQVGSYPVTFSITDDEGNSTKLVSNLEVIDYPQPFVTSSDATITAAEALAITTIDELNALTNVIAYDENNTDVTSKLEIDDDNFINKDTYASGDSFTINYTYTNESGISDSSTSTITIADISQYIRFDSDAPLAIRVTDNMSISEIIELANVQAVIYENDKKTASITLDESDLVTTNYQNKVGTYQFKMSYQAKGSNPSATYSFQVYVTEDGLLPGIKDVNVKMNLTEKIIPGQTINGEISIENTTNQSIIVNSIDLSTLSSNVSAISNLVVTDNTGAKYEIANSQSIKKLSSKSLNTSIKVPAGATYTITFDILTNSVFTYEEKIETVLSIVMGNDVRTIKNSSEVDADAISLKSNVSFDQANYTKSTTGTATVVIKNSGSMDTNVNAVEVLPSTTNIKKYKVFINGNDATNDDNYFIESGSTMTISIDFSVANTLTSGSDYFGIQFGNSYLNAVVPISFDEAGVTPTDSSGGPTNDPSKSYIPIVVTPLVSEKSEEESSATTSAVANTNGKLISGIGIFDFMLIQGNQSIYFLILLMVIALAVFKYYLNKKTQTD